MAVLGLRFCARAFSSCSKWGPLFIAVRGPLTIAVSLVEHRLQTHRLSNCGSRAQSLRGMWDPPRPGPEPVFPALASRLNHCATREAPNTNFIPMFFITIVLSTIKENYILYNKGIEPFQGVGSQKVFPELSPEEFTGVRLIKTEDKSFPDRRTSRPAGMCRQNMR